MRVYFAPMEGLTDSVYRHLHHRFFPGVDAYYMPFLSPTPHRVLTPREARELPPADTEPFRAVPQLLTKSAGDFLWAAEQCRQRGYDQVNLNLGCPSGTVTAKGKGAGLLRDPEALERLLEGIFEKPPLPVSVKTRLGFESPEEFPALLELLGRYPICELTVHPRVRRAFYSGEPQRQWFAWAADHTRLPLCYNGDLRAPEAVPGAQAVMLGRGLIADPGMLSPGGTDPEALGAFLDALLTDYTQVFGSRRNAMFRLKEQWSLVAGAIPGSERLLKRLRKTTDCTEFRALTRDLIRLKKEAPHEALCDRH